MADPTINIAIQQFRDIFLQEYQRREKLAGTSLEIHGAKGDAYKWPRLGNAEMVDRGAYSSTITPTMLDHTKITTTYEDKVLRTRIDKGEESLINATERALWANIHAGAYGRQRDQWKITALDAATNSIAVGTTNISLEKLIAAKEYLMGQEAPDGYFFVMSPNQLSALLKLEKLTSADYNSLRALVKGDVNDFMGFNFIIISDKNANGKLPKTGVNRTCYAYTREALGAVYRLDPDVKVWYSDDQMSWLADSRTIGGSSVLDNGGVTKIICDETK